MDHETVGIPSSVIKCSDRPKIRSAGNGYRFKFDSQELTVSPEVRESADPLKTNAAAG